MSAALQIYYSAFDAAFFKLPPPVRARIEAKIDKLGLRLRAFRTTGSSAQIVIVCALVITDY